MMGKMTTIEERKQIAIDLVQKTADKLIYDIIESKTYDYIQFGTYFHFHQSKMEMGMFNGKPQEYIVNNPLYKSYFSKVPQG